MLDCNRAQAQINDFLDGTLNASEAVTLMAHLRECAFCDREYRALKTTQTLLQGAAPPDGNEARDRVMARFRHTVGAQTPPEPARVWWRNPLPLGLTATAAVALLVLMAILPFNNAELAVNEPDTPAERQGLSLPSSGEMDNMTALHAVQSVNVLNNDAELNHEALADANSRLILASDETE